MNRTPLLAALSALSALAVMLPLSAVDVAWATPRAATAAASAVSDEFVGLVSIPMFAGPSKVGGVVRPNVRVGGNCGTAFVYLARVNGNQTRATYGFENLANVAVGYTAGAEFHNEDTGHVEIDRASGTLFFRRSFQRSVTKTTGSGDVVVFGHLHAIGTLYDCYNSPGFFDRIYVY